MSSGIMRGGLPHINPGFSPYTESNPTGRSGQTSSGHSQASAPVTTPGGVPLLVGSTGGQGNIGVQYLAALAAGLTPGDAVAGKSSLVDFYRNFPDAAKKLIGVALDPTLVNRNYLTQQEEEIVKKIWQHYEWPDVQQKLYAHTMDYDGVHIDRLMKLMPSDKDAMQTVKLFLSYVWDGMGKQHMHQISRWAQDIPRSVNLILKDMQGIKTHKQDSFIFNRNGSVMMVAGGKVFDKKPLAPVVGAGVVVKLFKLRFYNNQWYCQHLAVDNPEGTYPVIQSQMSIGGRTVKGHWVPRYCIENVWLAPGYWPVCKRLSCDIVISNQDIPLESWDSVNKASRAAMKLPRYDKGEVDAPLEPTEIAMLKLGRRERLAFGRTHGYRVPDLLEETFVIRNNFESATGRDSISVQRAATSDMKNFEVSDQITGDPIILHDNVAYFGTGLEFESDTQLPHDTVPTQVGCIVLKPIYEFRPNVDSILNKMSLMSKQAMQPRPSSDEAIFTGQTAAFDHDFKLAQPELQRTLSIPALEGSSLSTDEQTALARKVRALDSGNRFGSSLLLKTVCKDGSLEQCLKDVKFNDLIENIKGIFNVYLSHVTDEDQIFSGFLQSQVSKNLEKKSEGVLNHVTAVFDCPIWKEEWADTFAAHDGWCFISKLDFIYGHQWRRRTSYKPPDMLECTVKEDRIDFEHPETLPMAFWSEHGSANFKYMAQHMADAVRWFTEVYDVLHDESDAERSDEDKKNNLAGKCPGALFDTDRVTNKNSCFYDNYEIKGTEAQQIGAFGYQNTRSRRTRMIYVALQILFEGCLIDHMIEHSDVLTHLIPSERAKLRQWGRHQWLYLVHADQVSIHQYIQSFYLPFKGVWPNFGTTYQFLVPEDSRHIAEGNLDAVSHMPLRVVCWPLEDINTDLYKFQNAIIFGGNQVIQAFAELANAGMGLSYRGGGKVIHAGNDQSHSEYRFLPDSTDSNTYKLYQGAQDAPTPVNYNGTFLGTVGCAVLNKHDAMYGVTLGTDKLLDAGKQIILGEGMSEISTTAGWMSAMGRSSKYALSTTAGTEEANMFRKSAQPVLASDWAFPAEYLISRENPHSHNLKGVSYLVFGAIGEDNARINPRLPVCSDIDEEQYARLISTTRT